MNTKFQVKKVGLPARWTVVGPYMATEMAAAQSYTSYAEALEALKKERYES